MLRNQRIFETAGTDDERLDWMLPVFTKSLRDSGGMWLVRSVVPRDNEPAATIWHAQRGRYQFALPWHKISNVAPVGGIG